MAPIAYFFIPDVPDKARFLNPEEKAVAKARGVCQTGNGPRIGAINFKDLGLTLIDLKAWLTAVSLESIQMGLRTMPPDPSTYTDLRLTLTHQDHVLQCQRQLRQSSCVFTHDIEGHGL